MARQSLYRPGTGAVGEQEDLFARQNEARILASDRASMTANLSRTVPPGVLSRAMRTAAMSDNYGDGTSPLMHRNIVSVTRLGDGQRDTVGERASTLRAAGGSNSYYAGRTGAAAAVPSAQPAVTDPMAPKTTGPVIPPQVRLSNGSTWDTRYHPVTGEALDPADAADIISQVAGTRQVDPGVYARRGAAMDLGDLRHFARNPYSAGSGDSGNMFGGDRNGNGDGGLPPEETDTTKPAGKPKQYDSTNSPGLVQGKAVGGTAFRQNPVTGQFVTDVTDAKGNTTVTNFDEVLASNMELHRKAAAATVLLDAKLDAEARAYNAPLMAMSNTSFSASTTDDIIDADYRMAKARY